MSSDLIDGIFVPCVKISVVKKLVLTSMDFDDAFIKKLKNDDSKTQKLFYERLAPKMYGICLKTSATGLRESSILLLQPDGESPSPMLPHPGRHPGWGI